MSLRSDNAVTVPAAADRSHARADLLEAGIGIGQVVLGLAAKQLANVRASTTATAAQAPAPRRHRGLRVVGLAVPVLSLVVGAMLMTETGTDLLNTVVDWVAPPNDESPYGGPDAAGDD